VGDLGGGSMELIGLNNHTIRGQDTMPIGPLRLVDSCKGSASKMRKAIAGALNELSWLKGYKPSHFYAVGGSFRTLARIHLLREQYPLPILHHYTLPAYDLLPLLADIQEMDVEDVAMLPGVPKK